jgi:hypothetical protein
MGALGAMGAWGAMGAMGAWGAMGARGAGGARMVGECAESATQKRTPDEAFSTHLRLLRESLRETFEVGRRTRFAYASRPFF